MFKVGDVVQWTSQSSGYTMTKKGIVAEVITIGMRPDKDRFPSLYRGNGPGIGLPRNHESYVVVVGSKPYWPRVSQLKFYGTEGNDPASGYRRLAYDVLEPLLKQLSEVLDNSFLKEEFVRKIKDAHEKLLRIMSNDSRNQGK